jgi:outer membrane immunogenic protein
MRMAGGLLTDADRRGSRMRRLVVTSLAAAGLSIGLATAAAAADLGAPAPAPVYTKAPIAAPFSWTGFYVGANAGYSWSDITTTSSADCPAVNGYFCAGGAAAGLANVAVINADGSHSFKHNAFTGGGQVGYNLQFGSLVLGPELDIESFSAKASSSAGRIYPGNHFNTYVMGTATDTDWLFTARARAGWAAGNVLLYATGGLATTDLKVSNSFSDNDGAGATGASSHSQTKVGWTAGGGVEWAFARNWSLRGEYLHVDLGSVSTTEAIANASFPTLANSITTSSKLTSEIARAGVNYRFGP